MANPYVVRTTRFANSERFPVLMYRSTGEPIFETCIYSVSILRTKNLACSTMEAVLRALSVLFIFFDARRIDFQERLRQGTGLLIWEIDELMGQCKKPLELLAEELDSVSSNKGAGSRILNLEKARQKHSGRKEFEPVSNAGTRAIYIRDYLKWLMERQISNVAGNETKSLLMIEAKNSTIDGINARIPTDKDRDELDHREGLEEKQRELLRKIVTPGSALNPWKGEFFQNRNFLCVFLLESLGIRRGELLGLEIKDIKIEHQTIGVYRKADNPEDSRLIMPQTKTKDRILVMSDELTDLVKYYIMFIRCQKPLSRKHDFLIITSGQGKQMATRTLNAIFEDIVRVDPVLLKNLSPHTLRHTLNEILSTYFDAHKISNEKEERVRGQMMGWAKDSKMAQTYTKRHIREEAKKVSLAAQKKIGEKIGI